MHTRYLTHWILAFALFLSACATLSPTMPWTTLLENGKGMDNFVTQGDANWRVDNGLVLADQGKGGFLVTKKSYKDFEIRAEFWAASDTNSGIFIRATNPQKLVQIRLMKSIYGISDPIPNMVPERLLILLQ